MMKTLIGAMHANRFMIDKNNVLVAANDSGAQVVYNTVSFQEEIMKRYGLDSNKISNRKELDNRLDRAITGLETELTLKAASC